MSGTVVNHVGHVVADLDRAASFYEQVLGFTPWFRSTVPSEAAARLLGLPEPLEVTVAYLTLGEATLELIHHGRELPREPRGFAETGLSHLSLAVPDVAATAERARAHGAEVIEGTDLGIVLMIRDPDGQIVELLDAGYRDGLPPRP